MNGRQIDLRCAFCSKQFRWWNTLAEHVKEFHPEIRRLFLEQSERATIPQKGSTEMPKKKFDRLPTLDEELFEKLKNKKGEVVAKLDGCFVWKSKEGLTLNLSAGSKKFSFLVSFDRYDIRSLFNQMEGQEFKFIEREGKDRNFINVFNPYSKDN